LKIAVVGSGGREHCIVWRLARDTDQHTLFAVPGNGGTVSLAENIEVGVGDVSELHRKLRALAPDLVVIGPEAPLAAGIADLLDRDGIRCFGPSAAAAQIESSKAFAKSLMREHAIPTADFEIFDDFAQLEQFVRSAPYGNGWVVKADGLAAGKGAFVCASCEEVLTQAHSVLVEGTLGSAGRKVVLERKLAGREVSALFWCDGERFEALPPAQDYKRAQDGDLGPNTGGMGAYCPATHLTDGLRAQVASRIVKPTLQALAVRGTPYRGVLYVGLMLTEAGPQVIEFNCRFGDPETQVILPLWQGKMGEQMLACCEGRLQRATRSSVVEPRAAVCVVIAAQGYPGAYHKGIALKDAADSNDALTFHAGTRRSEAGLVSSGGRVLNAIGLGSTVAEARTRAYRQVERIRADGLRWRSDIAQGVE
jgi:phosphoribosylamine--glycine ligase